jgi:hypothetical protein
MTTETNAEPEVNPADAIRILKTASCPSLSSKSTLTYNIGCNAQGDIQFQVIANDGGGFWNDDWVPQSDIQEVLDRPGHGHDITSASFRSIYPSKSNNSPGFLLAVLKAVGLVQASKINQRCYELGSPKAFIAEINALMAAAPELLMAEAVDAPVSKKLTIKDKPIKP